MRLRGLVAAFTAVLLVMVNFPTAAQEPTSEPFYGPGCAMDMTQAYMSGWEYDHRDGTELDLVAAAQVARSVYSAFQPLKIDCQFANGSYKQSLLRSMHGDYPAEDLARMLNYLQEAVGTADYSDCAYAVAEQFIDQVDWADTNAVQVGRTIGDIYRTVREVVPSGECDGTLELVTNIMSQLDDIPPDATLVNTLYITLTTVTDGQPISKYECGYELANTFFESVDWDGLTSAAITQLVSDTFKITYGISGSKGCGEEPALAITAMLLDDVYAFAPDPNIIQRTYDAASGLPVEPTPTVTPAA